MLFNFLKTKKRQYEVQIEAYPDPVFIAGVNLDWKIRTEGYLFSLGLNSSSWVIRFRLTYQEILNERSKFGGNMISFTVGVGMMGRYLEREC